MGVKKGVDLSITLSLENLMRNYRADIRAAFHAGFEMAIGHAQTDDEVNKYFKLWIDHQRLANQTEPTEEK